MSAETHVESVWWCYFKISLFHLSVLTVFLCSDIFPHDSFFYFLLCFKGTEAFTAHLGFFFSSSAESTVFANGEIILYMSISDHIESFKELE